MEQTNESREYVTFEVEASDGRTLEMAVVDEFEFEKKNYVVGALVEGDVIQEEGVYIYRVKIMENKEFTVEKIKNHVEYNRVAQAYMEMDEIEEENEE